MDLEPFRDAQVRNLTTDDVREIYEMRVLLEPFALEKAVPRMDENDRGLLRSLVEDADDASEKVDLYGLSALNRELHDAFVARCGNKPHRNHGQSPRPTPSYLPARVDAQTHLSARSRTTQGVAKAVESRNVHRAADLLRMHIVGFEEQFVRTLEHQHIETGQIRRR